MNYDQKLQELITAIKADKSIVQPWRNKAISRLDETQAFLSMGKRMTNRPWPPDLVIDKANGEQVPIYREDLQCTCPNGGRSKECPVHGGW